MKRLPVVAHGAEHLVMGHLMRRNIMVYKAPPLNAGYDLICIHPEGIRAGKAPFVRIQVKSRFACEATGFPLQERTISAFDFLIMVFMNIGKFSGTYTGEDGCNPEFYTLPRELIRSHHQLRKISKSASEAMRYGP